MSRGALYRWLCLTGRLPHPVGERGAGLPVARQKLIGWVEMIWLRAKI